jgi:hypothetical protein
VELDVQLPQGPIARVGEIEIVGRASNRRDAEKLAGMVIGEMERFRRALTDRTDRRRVPRYCGEWAVNFYPINDDLAVAAPLAGVCLNFSAGGFRCVLPCSLPGEHAYLNFSGIEGVHATAVLIRVLRSETRPDGSVHVSGAFLLG